MVTNEKIIGIMKGTLDRNAEHVARINVSRRAIQRALDLTINPDMDVGNRIELVRTLRVAIAQSERAIKGNNDTETNLLQLLEMDGE